MAVNSFRAACAPLLLALVTGAGAAHARDARAPAGTPPPRWERLAELTPQTVFRIEQLRAAGVAGLPDARALARCAERAELVVAACTRARRPPALGCAARLAATAVALDRAARDATGAGAWIAVVVADAARLATLMGTLDRSRESCATEPADAPDAAVPAILAWRASGTALEVEPARPLDPGRSYRLVIEPPIAVAGTEPALDARGRLVAEPEPAAAVAAIRDYARRMQEEAARAPGVTTRPALVLRLADPVPLARVASLAASFRPAGDLGAADGIVVATAAPGLASAAPAARSPVRAGTTAVTPGERKALGLGESALAGADLRRGTFRSPAPAAGTTHDVPYLVALPRTRAHPEVAVLLLDGLGGSAAPFLGVRGASLLAEGLALVAMDLPGHGTRADGAPFLDARDPSVLAARLETAVRDVLALAAHLRTAPGALGPDEPPPASIRILGYSIGAAVASVALALEPAFGAAVLTAPPGDLAEFLAVSTSAAFGEPLLRCLAGGTLGGACGGEVVCPAGACIFNPTLLPLLGTRTAVRTLLAPVDPQTRARAVAGTDGLRPVLVQIGGRDGVVPPGNTIWLAAALGADLTCTRRPHRPQVLCRFAAAAHDVVWNPGARRQADAFLASGGEVLAPSGEPWAAR